MLKNKIKLNYYVLIISFINLVLYHLPLFKFATDNLDYESLDGVLTLASLAVLLLILNALIFYIWLFTSNFLGKFLLLLFLNINAIGLYFINTYGVIIDKTMIGNILNTNVEESTSFLSLGLFLYVILLGIIPGILIINIQFSTVKFKTFLSHTFLTFIFVLTFIYINSSSWLWIDKHSKSLGGMVMPWSYIVNTSRFYLHKNEEKKQEILLPNTTLLDRKKSIFVLVIGESARSKNFSLYGYEKNTNPLLSNINNIYSYQAKSCATYTTAGVKCILDHKETRDLYETLPNYLYRNDVDVIWRTTNWGEPKVTIDNYLKRIDLEELCKGNGCAYDELLLSGLSAQLLSSNKDKILLILHTSTSHGPTYYKKYPERFKEFTPVCENVELGKCTQEELINAYDNTILYTDYILATLIKQLKQLDGYTSSMFYVSDHGESLGENNLYMHGIPSSIAPEEQLEIPFIVWLSDNSSKELKKTKRLSQHNVFHSVLDFLALDSAIYDKEMSVFKN